MISTGDKGFDKVITGLCLGDNVVWQIDSVDDYGEIVDAFVKQAVADKRRVVYIRFASHSPLLDRSRTAAVYTLNASLGFESFSAEINDLVRKEGRGVFYVFDCLSDLLFAWSNDLMIGNFFKITCPFLFTLDTIAYFSILRNKHSFKTVARIRDTTQLLIDVYRYGSNYYVHPLKVWNRYSPSMFLPHIRKDGQFLPIASSVDTAKLFSDVFNKGARSAEQKLDFWDRLFMRAEDLSSREGVPKHELDSLLDQILRLIITRDEKILALSKRFITLEDCLAIKERMIGTGFIGGKSVGMLIARNILSGEPSLRAADFLEAHDSFYVGADVFYTYIVENGWWNERMDQRSPDGYFAVAGSLKEKLLHGMFPEEIKEQFQRMIEYFGQSPIIVRSSSLLEDSYGNAFAGKYESIFLANQGTPEERYSKFVEAVRRVYASTMNEDALQYRLKRGLDKMDEQMALLVQRVSGSFHGDYFFSDAAGVGLSYNAFVWKKDMDPKSGVLRLVAGLGTRSVNRVEGDYPRICALDAPLLKAYAGVKDSMRFSQHEVDVINVRENIFQTVPLDVLIAAKIDLNLPLIAVRDDEASELLRAAGRESDSWVITFDRLLANGVFCGTMQKMLRALENAYCYPVDTEFTVNFREGGEFRINLLQCRPMTTKGMGSLVAVPKGIPKDKIVFQSRGNFMGGNISQTVDMVIYVDPAAYCGISSQSGKYDIARAIGEINRRITEKDRPVVMLLGPGRWGTSTPSLGVPASFSEINNVSVLCEIAFSGNNVMPELSYGTHFFQDLVESGIFYAALFPDNRDGYFNAEFFTSAAPSLAEFAPDYRKYDRVIKIIDTSGKGLKIVSNIVEQKLVCYFKSGDTNT